MTKNDFYVDKKFENENVECSKAQKKNKNCIEHFAFFLKKKLNIFVIFFLLNLFGHFSSKNLYFIFHQLIQI